ncbi:MAG: hypothetical protein K0Q74_1326 [Gammaproteobacteria bacterium]|jgi:hypothetical protein|nr:hypothetical protein [Gammaproteobacteria bacterium]
MASKHIDAPQKYHLTFMQIRPNKLKDSSGSLTTIFLEKHPRILRY